MTCDEDTQSIVCIISLQVAVYSLSFVVFIRSLVFFFSFFAFTVLILFEY